MEISSSTNKAVDEYNENGKMSCLLFKVMFFKLKKQPIKKLIKN